MEWNFASYMITGCLTSLKSLCLLLMSQVPPREAACHTAGVKMATDTPAVITSATWLFVSKIREINLKKMIEKIHRPLNCRHWLQVERGGGIYYIRYLCNNWKSVSAFCFLLTKFNLATLCMWCCCHCFSSCLSQIVWHVTECSQAVKHSYFSLTPLENIFIEK